MIYLLITSLFLGQSPELKFPDKIVGRPGQFVELKPSSTNGKVVKYFVVTPGLEAIPSGLLKDPTSTIVQAQYPGVYVVYGFTASGDVPSDPVKIEVQIGQNPNPNPIPPNPPTPVPPDSQDALLEVLGPIWGALNEPNKIENAKTLSQYYRKVAEIYQDTSFITVGQAFQKIQSTRSSMLPNSALVFLRDAIGAELNKIMPRDPTTLLNDELRKKASEQYLRMAGLVEKLIAGSN